ncbi:MAG: hypothetical protein GXO91_10700 [FCB group bacterium]|nr:hypothetical protein [FCB group bacterium]
MESENYFLEQKIIELENDVKQLKSRLPDSNLISPKFFKRAFAVLGHNLVAGLLVSIPLYILLFIIASLFLGGTQYMDYGY